MSSAEYITDVPRILDIELYLEHLVSKIRTDRIAKIEVSRSRSGVPHRYHSRGKYVAMYDASGSTVAALDLYWDVADSPKRQILLDLRYINDVHLNECPTCIVPTKNEARFFVSFLKQLAGYSLKRQPTQV